MVLDTPWLLLFMIVRHNTAILNPFWTCLHLYLPCIIYIAQVVKLKSTNVNFAFMISDISLEVDYSPKLIFIFWLFSSRTNAIIPYIGVLACVGFFFQWCKGPLIAASLKINYFIKKCQTLIEHGIT